MGTVRVGNPRATWAQRLDAGLCCPHPSACPRIGWGCKQGQAYTPPALGTTGSRGRPALCGFAHMCSRTWSPGLATGSLPSAGAARKGAGWYLLTV